VQFALPLLDQVRWCNDEDNLIVCDLPTQLLNHTGGYRYRGGASDQGFANSHLPDQ
jgi:hypothetical protein